MKFKILTLFPEIIKEYFKHGVLKRGIEDKLISVETFNIRDYGIGKYKQVDDEPYGGGSGMLMRVDVLANALKSIAAIDKNDKIKEKVILMSPQGKTLNNEISKFYAQSKEDIIIICGRYEGIDQRFIDLFVDEEVSIGDFVISGGELGALVFIDAVSRFVSGVVGNSDSVLSDSFQNDLLKYPQYTRPKNYEGYSVPEVLLSGNHKLIENWRKNKSYEITKEKREDLLKNKGPK